MVLDIWAQKKKEKKIFRKHSQVCVLATWMIGKVSVIGNVNRLIICTKENHIS